MLLNGEVIEPLPPAAALLSTKIVFGELTALTWNQKLKSPPATPFRSPSSGWPAQVHERLIGRDRAEAQLQVVGASVVPPPPLSGTFGLKFVLPVLVTTM